MWVPGGLVPAKEVRVQADDKARRVDHSEIAKASHGVKEMKERGL